MLQIRFPNISFAFLDPSTWTQTSITLPKPAVYDTEGRREKPARTLKHLIKANHINHSVIYNHLHFHNHTPHILGSAYIFGADAPQLHHIYETESRTLEPWKDSPGEISEHDWRDFLGKKEYQRAFLDFFEDQLVKCGYDWRAVIRMFLLEGKEPLINNLIAGLGHSLIHLGYAEELASQTVALESLALAACFYNDWHVFLDDPRYTYPVEKSEPSLFAILARVQKDAVFDGLSDHRGSENIATLLANDEMAASMLMYWNTWRLESPKEQFAESQKLAVALLVATQYSNQKDNRYDFFAVHLLTTSHAVRILLPFLPAKHHVPLVRQWFLFVLLVYIAQLRPVINIDAIKLVELDGKDWSYIAQHALASNYRTDAHYVKALRCMREAASTWGDSGHFYLKAAVKLADEFDGWGGFGPLQTDVAAEENQALRFGQN